MRSRSAAAPEQVVLVTGASRGIGRSIAERIATAGCGVVVNYHASEEAAQALVESIRCRGAWALGARADVADLDALRRIADEVRKAWGRLDAIVHNASAPMRRMAIERTEWEEFNRHWSVQVRGAFNLTQAFLKDLQASSGQFIFILSSVVLHHPPAQVSAYATGKYALLGFARSLGVEVMKSGVRVNMVSPFVTPTDMHAELAPRALELMAQAHPLHRLASVEDTAAVVAFLLSHEARYINMAHIPVTGGVVS